MRMSSTRCTRLLALVITCAAACLGSAAPSAGASGRQVSLFEDDDAMAQNPASTMQELRHLGVKMVRVNLRWSYVAPDPMSRRRPNFNAADPNAYPPGQLAAVRRDRRQAARADGIQVMFTPTAFAPLWAQGANPARYGAKYDWEYAFMPSANAYKQFVEAAGKRYPSVRTWELYNEPNFGEDLAPQAINHSNVLYAPVMYRGLINAAWQALHATGHGRDTIIIGSLAAHGAHAPSTLQAELRPARRVRRDSAARVHPRPVLPELQLPAVPRRRRGRVRKCPTTAPRPRDGSAPRTRRCSSPAASRPIPIRSATTAAAADARRNYKDPNFAGFSQLPNMISATLDQDPEGVPLGQALSDLEHRVRVHHQPAEQAPNISPRSPPRRYYDNWAEYLSWKNPRVASAMQYLLYDPNPSRRDARMRRVRERVGAITRPRYDARVRRIRARARRSPDWTAYRMPIFLPAAGETGASAVKVWGCVQTGPVAVGDTAPAADRADPVPAPQVRRVVDGVNRRVQRTRARAAISPGGSSSPRAAR